MEFEIDSKLDQQNLRLSMTPRRPESPDKYMIACNPLEFRRTIEGVPIYNGIWAAKARIYGVALGTVYTYTIENKETNDILFQKRIR